MTLTQLKLVLFKGRTLFGLLMQHYFHQRSNLQVLRHKFSEKIQALLTRTDGGSPINLDYDPVSVYNFLSPAAAMQGKADNHRRQTAFKDPMVKNEVRI